MPRLIYSRLARFQLAELEDYIAESSGHPTVAKRFATELKDHCQRISVIPKTAGRSREELGPGLRSVAHGAYLIFIRYNGDQVEIVAIRHAARDLATFSEVAPD